MASRVPISLVTGSLGSGKTTLIRQILDTVDRRLAVLMNEFGEIPIDSRVIEGENVQIVELAGGCVCCELTGELEAAVTELIEKIVPDFIVLEATGVAEADALVYQVEDNLPMIRLDSVIGIVDAFASIKYPQLGYAARSQLAAADIVLINKIDLVTADQITEVEAQVRKYNDTAALFKTVQCELDIDFLFGLDIGERQPVSAGGHLHETEFQSFVFTSESRLDREKFEHVISRLPHAVYRAKGFVHLAENGYLFNYVAGRFDLEKFSSDRTQLVFIGAHLDALRDTILDKLRSCEA